MRHGHAVYALGLASDMADLKATDGIYDILTDDRVMERIGGLTK